MAMALAMKAGHKGQKGPGPALLDAPGHSKRVMGSVLGGGMAGGFQQGQRGPPRKSMFNPAASGMNIDDDAAMASANPGALKAPVGGKRGKSFFRPAGKDDAALMGGGITSVTGSSFVKSGSGKKGGVADVRKLLEIFHELISMSEIKLLKALLEYLLPLPLAKIALMPNMGELQSQFDDFLSQYQCEPQGESFLHDVQGYQEQSGGKGFAAKNSDRSKSKKDKVITMGKIQSDNKDKVVTMGKIQSDKKQPLQKVQSSGGGKNVLGGPDDLGLQTLIEEDGTGSSSTNPRHSQESVCSKSSTGVSTDMASSNANGTLFINTGSPSHKNAKDDVQMVSEVLPGMFNVSENVEEAVIPQDKAVEKAPSKDDPLRSSPAQEKPQTAEQPKSVGLKAKKRESKLKKEEIYFDAQGNVRRYSTKPNQPGILAEQVVVPKLPNGGAFATIHESTSSTASDSLAISSEPLKCSQDNESDEGEDSGTPSDDDVDSSDSSDFDQSYNFYEEEGSEDGDAEKRKSMLPHGPSHWGLALTIQDENAHILGKKTAVWIIHPHHRYRMIWDIFALVLILIESVVIPLEICFQITVSIWWWYFTTTFFFTDIVLNCITGFFERGILIMRQSWIMKRYAQSFMILDVISTFPWKLVITDGHGTSLILLFRLAKLIRLLRLAKVGSLSERLEEFLPSMALRSKFSLMKMLFIVFLICHWSACVWAFIGNPSQMGLDPEWIDVEECDKGGACEKGIMGSPWIKRYSLHTLSMGHLYVTALHFAVSAVIGGNSILDAGYFWELLIGMMLMFLSFGVGSVILSQLVVILQKMNEDHAEFRENLATMREFMTHQKVPITLQGKIQRYLEFQHEKAVSGSGNCEELLQSLSPSLGLELMESIHGKILSQHPFFLELPPRIFKRVCAVARTVLYAPGDMVVQRGHRAAAMCFIIRGKLRILANRKAQAKANRASKMSMKSDMAAEDVELESPSWIGDLCLFTEMVRSNTVISITHSELLMVSKDSVVSLVMEFPKLQPVYESWQKKIEDTEESGEVVGLRCECCGGLGHSAANCPKLVNQFGNELSDQGGGKGKPAPPAMLRSKTRDLGRASKHGSKRETGLRGRFSAQVRKVKSTFQRVSEFQSSSTR